MNDVADAADLICYIISQNRIFVKCGVNIRTFLNINFYKKTVEKEKILCYNYTVWKIFGAVSLPQLLLYIGGTKMKRCIAAFSDRSTQRGQTFSFDDVYERICENGEKPILIIFASDYDNFRLYAGLFGEKFPSSQVIGMSSFTSSSSEGFSKEGLSALAVYEGIECAGGVLTDAGRCPILHINEARNAIAKLGIGENDKGSVCCLEFTTAYGKCEEPVLDTLREASGKLDIPVFGSTAGVRRGTERSCVSLNGEIYEDACVFMYIRNLGGKINIIRENTYKHTDNFFLVTNVDCERRIVREINGRPAAPYMASLLDTDVPVLAKNIMLHPIGRFFGDKIYITDAEAIEKDGSVSFFSHIYNYSRGVLLEPHDANACGRRLVDKVKEVGFEPSFAVAVNCAFDFDIFEDKGFTEDITKSLTDAAGCFVGMSGCGEQVDNIHINKTMLLAVFE